MKNIFFNKKSLFFAALTTVVLALGSCNEEYLDTAPDNVFTDVSVFKSAERVKQLIQGLYDNVKSGQYYGGRFMVYGDIRGEEFLNETTNGVTGFSTWNHTIISNTNEVTNLWNSVYYAINSANIVIAGLENEENKKVLNNPTLVTNYIAEARFIRALCYQSLLTLYARPFADGGGNKLGLPLRLAAETGIKNNDLARSTVAEVYAQILNDLNFAEQNLPASYASAYLNTTRAHRNTVIALKTRVYMAMGRWADVITEANKIVPAAAPFRAASGVAHQLQADVVTTFSTPYTTVESILSMPMTELDLPGTQNGLGSYYNPGPRGVGDFSLNPRGIIGDSVNFKVADRRRTFITINASNRKPYLTKFPAGPQHLDYAPVLRYSEVLLNLAEALVRTEGAGSTRALALLNAVHGRSDAATVFAAANFANATAFLNILAIERRIELLGEGFRSFDVMRVLQDIPGKANVGAIKPTQSEYIWPIPQSELAVNKLCVQNP
jgi:hypothetical protein